MKAIAARLGKLGAKRSSGTAQQSRASSEAPLPASPSSTSDSKPAEASSSPVMSKPGSASEATTAGTAAAAGSFAKPAILPMELDDASLARVVSHRVFGDAQQIILLLRLAPSPTESRLVCVTKPSLVLHVLHNCTISASLPLGSINSLTFKSPLIVSISSSPSASAPAELSLPLLNQAEVSAALVCIPRLCRTFTPADPTGPPLADVAPVDLAQRCPVLADLDAFHLVSRRRRPAPLEDELVDLPPAALPPAAGKPLPEVTLKQWEADSKNDPIALLAARLESVGTRLAGLEEWTTLPVASMQALHARHLGLSRTQSRLSALHSLIQAILANPLPVSPAPPQSLLLALQAQVEGASFTASAAPHSDFMRYAQELAELRQRFSALPRKLRATQDALAVLEPACESFGSMIAQHVSQRVLFYYSYDLIEPAKGVLPRYLALLRVAEDAFPGVMAIVEQTWTPLLANLFVATPWFDLQALVDRESALVEGQFGLSLDLAITLASSALLAKCTSLSVTAKSLADCDRTPPPQRFADALVEPLRSRLEEQVGALIARARVSPELFVTKELSGVVDSLKEAGVHRAWILRNLCKALVTASDSLKVLHACAAVDTALQGEFSARLELAAREALEMHEPLATVFTGGTLLDTAALEKLGKDMLAVERIKDLDVHGPVVRALVVERAAKLAQDCYWKLAVNAAEAHGVVLVPSPDQVEALLLKRL